MFKSRRTGQGGWVVGWKKKKLNGLPKDKGDAAGAVAED